MQHVLMCFDTTLYHFIHKFQAIILIPFASRLCNINRRPITFDINHRITFNTLRIHFVSIYTKTVSTVDSDMIIISIESVQYEQSASITVMDGVAMNHVDTGSKTAAGTRPPLWRTRLLDAESCSFTHPAVRDNHYSFAPKIHAVML